MRTISLSYVSIVTAGPTCPNGSGERIKTVMRLTYRLPIFDVALASIPRNPGRRWGSKATCERFPLCSVGHLETERGLIRHLLPDVYLCPTFLPCRGSPGPLSRRPRLLPARATGRRGRTIPGIYQGPWEEAASGGGEYGKTREKERWWW